MGVCYLITYKVDGNAWKLKTHVTGALLNRHTKAAAFIDCCEWPHDSNLTINIILHILLWVQTTVMKNVFLVLNEGKRFSVHFLVMDARRMLAMRKKSERLALL